MLSEIYNKNNKDAIHFNEAESNLFQKRINEVFQEHKFRKITRQERSKIPRMDKQKIAIVGIAKKLLYRV